jgi:hypothetical protein
MNKQIFMEIGMSKVDLVNKKCLDFKEMCQL